MEVMISRSVGWIWRVMKVDQQVLKCGGKSIEECAGVEKSFPSYAVCRKFLD